MPPRSIFDYDVSVAADKRRRTRERGMSGALGAGERACEWPGCAAKAAYRAPTSPERLHEYRWFCLEHVREYNAGWNFFRDWSEDELSRQLEADRVWERPTWALGEGPSRAPGRHPNGEGRAWARFGFADPFEVLGENATINPPPDEDAPKPKRRLSREEQRAMDTLDLPHQVEGRATIRARYRSLVKDLHPDMNGGQNPDPDRLRRVLRAWDVLKKSRHFKD